MGISNGPSACAEVLTPISLIPPPFPESLPQVELVHTSAGNPTLVIPAQQQQQQQQQQLLRQGQSVQLSVGDAFALVATKPRDVLQLVLEGEDGQQQEQQQQQQQQQQDTEMAGPVAAAGRGGAVVAAAAAAAAAADGREKPVAKAAAAGLGSPAAGPSSSAAAAAARRSSPTAAAAAAAAAARGGTPAAGPRRRSADAAASAAAAAERSGRRTSAAEAAAWVVMTERGRCLWAAAAAAGAAAAAAGSGGSPRAAAAAAAAGPSNSANSHPAGPVMLILVGISGSGAQGEVAVVFRVAGGVRAGAGRKWPLSSPLGGTVYGERSAQVCGSRLLLRDWRGWRVASGHFHLCVVPSEASCFKSCKGSGHREPLEDAAAAGSWADGLWRCEWRLGGFGLLKEATGAVA